MFNNVNKNQVLQFKLKNDKIFNNNCNIRKFLTLNT